VRFDSTVTIEPDTGRAILWADTPMGTRFRVIIDPQYAIDLWGLRRPLEASRFLAAIREHMDEITTAAVSAFADGELVLQLD
jgi:hypothetical protein